MVGEKRQKTREANSSSTTLATLFDRYRSELVAFARTKVGDGPPDPEDLAQQAFARFAALKEPQRVSNERAFLYRTVANLVIDHFKGADYRRSVPCDPSDFEDLSVDRDQISPEIVLLDKERYALVLAAVEKLPRRQRRFLILNRLEGMSYTEIAARNGVCISTARREVEIAVGACRQALLRLNDYDED